MIYKQEKLTPKERRAQEAFEKTLSHIQRKTKNPIIVAFIGLVGSGKSSVAKELAKHIGAVVIEGDAIRVELRKQSECYERARLIAENVALRAIERGANVVLDSDFIDANKRASIRKKAQQRRARLVFVRTHCDIDVMVGHTLSANYKDTTDDFFGGASSSWGGSAQSKGAAVKVREMYRRTPQHYQWINKDGGAWKLKKLPFQVLAMIDTTDTALWKKQVAQLAKKLGVA
ncbi:hypothetical protein A3J56_01925 [Candidatus Giovannonibacteria bacterium RIFCSPHIGHO2_02_FULL_46_20]|uniref:UDP-N-acetylglucosamine kinase n=1 Tax=Candidatus Giovannonibacteria bacterium RIFCSPHIGHO2_02_FULL_46_20 TaxID=1798338 RepID=A0A1F5WDD7_9BACT|nr:MAG: hypothetical protein A3J56_01925 [Candidatus Giovannonibacteria bacterium RIFCSPHIGHO2_02_FULL_46_20]